MSRKRGSVSIEHEHYLQGDIHSISVPKLGLDIVGGDEIYRAIHILGADVVFHSLTSATSSIILYPDLHRKRTLDTRRAPIDIFAVSDYMNELSYLLGAKLALKYTYTVRADIPIKKDAYLGSYLRMKKLYEIWKYEPFASMPIDICRPIGLLKYKDQRIVHEWYLMDQIVDGKHLNSIDLADDSNAEPNYFTLGFSPVEHPLLANVAGVNPYYQQPLPWCVLAEKLEELIGPAFKFYSSEFIGHNILWDPHNQKYVIIDQ